jgi:Transcription factor WhiB
MLDYLRRYREPADWWEQAACRGQGPEAWFPEPEPRRRAAPLELRELCDGCPVRDECAQAGKQAYAGVWAGRLVSTNRSALKDIVYRGPRPPKVALVG